MISSGFSAFSPLQFGIARMLVGAAALVRLGGVWSGAGAVLAAALLLGIHRRYAAAGLLVADLACGASAADVPQLLVTHPALPVKTTRDLVELARKRPGDINYGSAGNGSTSHLSMALFNSVTGTKMVHVPYKGSVQATTDLVAGTLQAGTNTMPASLPFVKSGRLRAVAITTPRRSLLLPDVPTVAESGVPGYEVTLWTGVFSPTGTPKEIVAQYGREIEVSLAQPDTREALSKLGSEVNFSPLEPFTAFMRAEYAKWVKVTREANIRLDQQ